MHDMSPPWRFGLQTTHLFFTLPIQKGTADRHAEAVATEAELPPDRLGETKFYVYGCTKAGGTRERQCMAPEEHRAAQAKLEAYDATSVATSDGEGEVEGEGGGEGGPGLKGMVQGRQEGIADGNENEEQPKRRRLDGIYTPVD